MDLLTSTIMGLLFGAAIIYGALRIIAGRAGERATALAVPGPGLDSGPSDEAGRDAARRHAFWTALIAFFASGLSAASDVGDIPAAYYAGYIPGPSWLADLLTILVPLVSLAGIYIIGQYTWPKPRGSVRRADISIRRLRDYIPSALLTVMIAAAVLAVTAAFAVWDLPGIEGFSGTQTFDGVEVSGEHNGRRSGSYFAPILLIGILTLAAGVATATAIIVRRRSVDSLDRADNDTLRRILINRLFRTATLLFAALGTMAVNFAHQRSPALILGGPAPATGWEPAQQLAGWLTVTLMIAMALWRPPLMAPDGGTSSDGAAGPVIFRGSYAAGQEITESAHTAGLIVAALAIVPLSALTAFDLAVAQRFMPLAFVIPTAIFLAAIASGEVHIWRGHTRARNPHSLAPATAQPRSHTPPTPNAVQLVPRPLLAAVAGGAVLLATVFGFNAAAPGRQPDLLAAFAVAGAAVLLLGAAAILLVHRRPPLFEATPEADSMLRCASGFRVARMTAAGMFALTAQLLNAHPAAWGWFLDGGISLYLHQLSPGLHTALRITTAVLYLAAIVLALLPGASRPRRSMAGYIGHPVTRHSGASVPRHSGNAVSGAPGVGPKHDQSAVRRDHTP